MADFNPCILIPVYRHGKACMNMIEKLESYCREKNVKIILVDDGNAEETKNFLIQIKNTYQDFVELVVLSKNQGKGGAFKAGILRASQLGFTHALQLDADGQHDWTRSDFFFEKAKKNPSAMILGYPEYDESVPGHRKNGRKFANTWCALVTWQRGIVDSMCGFRIYPVEETAKFLTKHYVDSRMGFDIEIIVKLIWKGLPFEFYPVKVTYPSDGISNFNVLKDNVRISWVFTRLCCGMFIRIPKLLWRKIK
ncbi:glycosyltransferase family 2 protein [Treponema sp.]|uniref:glycosyltransferase family 2 protein n=1 Tax=Treponema sp. TaxID=166 RepID=UPI00388FAEDB